MQRSIFDFSLSTSRTTEFVDLTDGDTRYDLDCKEQLASAIEANKNIDKHPISTNLLPHVDINESKRSEVNIEEVKIEEIDKPASAAEAIDAYVETPSTDDSYHRQNTKIKSEELLSESFIAEVFCPVCLNSIEHLSVELRVVHVEACLAPKQPIKQELQKQQAIDKKEAIAKKRKEAEEQTRNERMKNAYKNIHETKVVTAEEKSITQPLKIRRVQSKRRPIPPVKVLSFPVETDFSSYKIAVDAFNYLPQDDISQYILTHFHADHYGGISKNWCYERVFDDQIVDEEYRKIIYCTSITAKLLTLRFSVDPRFIELLLLDKTYMIRLYFLGTPEQQEPTKLVENPLDPGLYVTPITANHCPGAAIFLLESIALDMNKTVYLHCGDFRVNLEILTHPRLKPFLLSPGDCTLMIDKVYLDTTYMNPEYNFPKQETVCNAVAAMFERLTLEQQLFTTWFGKLTQSRITDFLRARTSNKKKFLIVVGTYVIGKENLAIAILKRLGGCPIYVSTIGSRDDKYLILRTYNNAYLDLVLVRDDLPPENQCQCVIHLVPMSIVSSVTEMSKYFNDNKYFESFERCVGLRPTGWTFLKLRQGAVSHDITLPDLFSIMKQDPKFTYEDDILPQAPPVKPDLKRLNTSLYRIYTLPYSEHSSFRELSYFAVMLLIRQIIPTVNIESTLSIHMMNQTIKIWEAASSERMERREGFDIALDDF